MKSSNESPISCCSSATAIPTIGSTLNTNPLTASSAQGTAVAATSASGSTFLTRRRSCCHSDCANTGSVTSRYMSSVFTRPTPRPDASSSVKDPAVNGPESIIGSTLSGYPQLDQLRGLTPPFVAPNVIVPIDPTNPTKMIGNSYTAQISPTRSTLFVFDMPPSSPKTCNLVFTVPPAFDPTYIAPMQISSPGGITVSRLVKSSADGLSASSAARSDVVGAVPALQPGNKYTIASAPCGSGQQVTYRADSLDGLDMDFFQMTSPALGLFMEAA